MPVFGFSAGLYSTAQFLVVINQSNPLTTKTVLTEILEINKSRLLEANSYLCPYLDRMIGLFRKLEENGYPDIL